MFTKDTLKLSWEWPAGRSPQQKLLVIVDSIKKEKNISISNSASMTAHLPDPMILTAHVIEGSKTNVTKLSLRLPEMELGNIAVNDQVVIGLDEGDISICVEKVPEHLEKDAISTWFSSWNCSKK